MSVLVKSDLAGNIALVRVKFSLTQNSKSANGKLAF